MTRSKTTLETLELTKDDIKNWLKPDFQRPFRANSKVQRITSDIESDGVLPGILTIGIVNRKKYLIDGQHRIEAFKSSKRNTVLADVRFVTFETLADMGKEFVDLNSRLVNMRPDDILRGLEPSIASLAKIRKRCPFVDYTQIRRNETSPVLSMSAVLRCWNSSAAETPTGACPSAATLAQTLSSEEADLCCQFLDLAMQAWGRDQSYWRLWGNMNLTICMWLYRRIVIAPSAAKRTKMTPDQFRRCLMQLSADENYLDWLVGRHPGSSMSPAYMRVKGGFAKRYLLDTGSKALLPQPSWASR